MLCIQISSGGVDCYYCIYCTVMPPSELTVLIVKPVFVVGHSSRLSLESKKYIYSPPREDTTGSTYPCVIGCGGSEQDRPWTVPGVTPLILAGMASLCTSRWDLAWTWQVFPCGGVLIWNAMIHNEYLGPIYINP